MLLAVDIGGTKTLFQLSTVAGKVICEQSFVSQDFASFDLVLSEFLALNQLKDYKIDSACFAVAGPVSGRNANVTNLPWQLNADDLATKFAIETIHLCNDFAAVAHGIAELADDEIVTLQQGEEDKQSPRAVIGAGTGLGQAILVPDNDGWRVIATEGGHADFAPTDTLQIQLLEYMLKKFDHISYERIVSGVGLVEIYAFLCSIGLHKENDDCRQAMLDADDAAVVISQFAVDNNDDLASAALNLFIKIYGAQAGNLALTVLPLAGLYIAGGIAAKNLQHFKQGGFIAAFNAKGKMKSVVEKIPVRLILQPKVGLIGARLLARRSVV